MRKISQIRESNDILFEMDDSQSRKLTALARAGLFDPKKINFIKRALDKDVKSMTPADKKALIELLDSLIAEVLGSAQVYSKVKQEVMKEQKDFLSKYDPRFDKNYPSEKDLPQIIILKRKAIRVYPDSQKVGLYYSQALDKYVSIPFGPGLATMSEETELNEKSTKIAVPQNTAKIRKNKKNPSLIDKAIEDPAGVAGSLIGGGLHKAIKTALFHPTVGLIGRPMPSKPKSVGKTTTQSSVSVPKTIVTPQASLSTSGKTSASFSAPKTTTTSKITIKPKAQTSKVPSSDQPSDAGLAAAAKLAPKTKTSTYSSELTPARELTPLERETGTTNKKSQLPRKRFNFDPKVPGTGPQPVVNLKSPGKTFKNKLDEKRQLNEVAVAVGNRAIRMGTKLGAGKSLRDVGLKFIDANKDQIARIGSAIASGLGVGIGATSKKPEETLHQRQRQAADDRDTQSITTHSALLPRNKEKDIEGEITKVAKVEVPAPVVIKPQDTTRDIAVPTDKPQQVSGASVPKADDITGTTGKSGTETSIIPAAAGAASTAAAVTAASATKTMLDRKKGKDRPRPRSRPRLPVPSIRPDDLYSKELSPDPFTLQAKINKPGGDVRTAFDQRVASKYKQSLEKSLQKEASEEDIQRYLEQYRQKTNPFALKVKTNEPVTKQPKTALQTRMRNLEIKSNMSESNIIDRLRNITEEEKINISGNKININNNMAEKIVSLYDSLSGTNKVKMESMLSESAESFKKVVNFAIKQV